MTKRTSVFENALLWFGAAVSLAEIQAGMSLAPLGWEKGLAAIALGHLIGCGMLFLAGLLGVKTRKSAMETVKMSFGQAGGTFFSVLNILQLLGWTAIMILDGAAAAQEIWGIGRGIWCAVIGGLIVLWIAIGLKNLGKINTVAMAALFLLTIVLSVKLFGGMHANGAEGMSFGAAVELSAAMPISWLPLIADYTREAEKPVLAAAVSAGVYGLVSSWMYAIGMGAALLMGGNFLPGAGIAGLVVIVFSTVTTTFLDAWSAGISCEAVFKRCKGKYAAIAVTILGTLGAIFFPMTDLSDFLYFIGSVFAPMLAVQIAESFILQKRGNALCNLLIWLLGFAAYRILMTVELPVGNTLVSMVFTIGLRLAFQPVLRRMEKKKISNSHKTW